MIKTLLAFALFVSANIPKAKPEIKESFLRIEVHCSGGLRILKEKDLCPEGVCPWRQLEKSKSASIWQRGADELSVIEVPNEKILRIKFKKGISQIPSLWCPGVKESTFSWSELNKKDLKLVKEKKGTLYLLSPQAKGQWQMLKEIDHACRKLVEVKSHSGLSWLYLRPSEKKGCL